MSATVKGRGLLNRVIDALPFELHIPGYQFYGPGTHLEKRLARGDRDINSLDAACREYDIAYSRSNDLVERQMADKILAEKARKRIIARNSTLGERAAAAAVWAAMKVKTKIGMGTKTKMKTKKKTKRILPTVKRGGILRILPMLGTLGSLIDGAWQRRSATAKTHDASLRSCSVTIARWKDCILLHTNMVRDYISARRQGVITKEKKNVKNACGCDNKHTVGSSGKTHACTTFYRFFYA